MKHMKALLINPHIYDVSAYGFWSAPLGLLYVGSILRENGADLQFIDCLTIDETKRKADGRAPFPRARVARPLVAGGLGKRFKRYGMSPDLLRSMLQQIEEPDLVLVTCIMTYWYPGAMEVVGIVREVFPRTKIVVGGLYPSLCYDHATTHLGADLIVRGGELRSLYAFIEEMLSRPLTFKPGMEDLERLPYPAFDLYEKPFFVPLLTSLGCVYKCTYCATPYLHPKIIRRSPGSVLDEILYWHDRAVSRFALYDDNFLFDKETYAKPFLNMVKKLPFPVSFHNPNALNASLIDQEAALLLVGAGFSEVRLGLETVDPKVQRATGGKIDRRAFEKAVCFLRQAGLDGSAICVYVLAGLPLQGGSDVRNTVDYVSGLGLRVSLAHYSPIPHTPLYDAHRALARYPIAEDPLFQNNALFPFAWEGFTEQELDELKAHVRAKNRLLGDHGES